MTIRLPDRPGRYAFGPNLPRSRIDVQEIDGGAGFTVTRVIDGVTWAPLDGRDNPAWLTWPREIEAAAWVYEVSPVFDYAHWGAVPA